MPSMAHAPPFRSCAMAREGGRERRDAGYKKGYAAVVAEALADLRAFSSASAARISESRCWT